MRTSRLRAILLCLSVAAAACRGNHDHRHGEHEQGHDHGHGHGHDENGLPAQSVTRWTEKHELFIDHPPLIAGRATSFATHVTMLPAYQPLAEGKVTVSVALAGGAARTGAATVAKPPGLFRPEVTPDRAGPCKLTVTIEGAGGAETIDAGACEVFADEAAARSKLGQAEDPPGRITYTKEQQWSAGFAAQGVAERELQPGVRSPGEIRPVAGREARLTAPTAGRVALAEPAPVLGMEVQKGQVLATIAPRAAGGGDRASLDAEVAAARAELDGAAAAVARADRLLAEQAIPARQLEEARTRARVAQARLDAATGRVAQYAATASGTGGARGAFQIRSPIDGTLVGVEVASGQTIEEGQPLLVVMDLERVWLVAQVFEPDLPRVEQARAAWFTIDGYDAPFRVDEAAGGRVVTLGRMIDPETRTVPLIFELPNPGGRLRVGQFAKVVIATGAPARALAIPDAAIALDAGQPVAFVQVEGEAFERRPLVLGIRSGGWSEVKRGLAAGERVVTRGAYDIKLASAAGAIPDHGHVH